MANGFDAYYQWLGIPPKDQPPNHYRLLGVELFESNPDVIESAADRQMAHVRSFQSGPHGDVSQKLLNEITAAKLCLLNSAKKTEYDAKLRADKEAAEAAARPPARAVRGERPVAKAQPIAVGRWFVSGSQVRIAFENATRGTVRLTRNKDKLVGQQTLQGGELVAWELSRPDRQVLGRWVVRYTNGAVRTYEFRDDATVLFVGERVACPMIKDGDYYLLDFQDGKLDRATFDTTLHTEHYNPRSALAAGGKPDQIGRGVREP